MGFLGGGFRNFSVLGIIEVVDLVRRFRRVIGVRCERG